MNKTLTAVKERPLKCRKEFILTCEIDIKGNKMLYFNSPHFIANDTKGASPWKQKSWQDCKKGNSSWEY